MKKFLTLTFFNVLFIPALFSQEKMMISKRYIGTTYYDGHSILINSLQQLPLNIQKASSNFLNKTTGTLFNNITFSQGQIVDLDKLLSSDTSLYEREWVIPKYDLIFLLQDTTIGIRNYYLQLRLDKYGQILSSNWPRKYYSNKSLFKSREQILQFALQQAQAEGFDTSNYLIDFTHNYSQDKLCWLFKFKNNSNPKLDIYDVIEVDWISLTVVAKYRILTSKVN